MRNLQGKESNLNDRKQFRTEGTKPQQITA